ncbi:putative serine/threonine-protein kinase PIX13 [Apium graveolens]|uniref:putative serine/threonine-protein kinase PIX13 n=1 Tax=Apium graveolens TaxID=4045 RepID=UPI003D7AEB35
MDGFLLVGLMKTRLLPRTLALEWQFPLKDLIQTKNLELCRALLVSEYTTKGTLERYAYKDNGKSLSWVVWLKILIGAARYLDFLHSSNDRIIFGDFKPSHVLLDGVA